MKSGELVWRINYINDTASTNKNWKVYCGNVHGNQQNISLL